MIKKKGEVRDTRKTGYILPLLNVNNKGMTLKRFFKYCELTSGKIDDSRS